MNKRFFALISAAACAALCFAGCSENNQSEEPTAEPYETKFEDDLLCGYRIKFFEEPIEEIPEMNKSLESGEAVAAYSVIEHRDELGGYNILRGYEGLNFFERVKNNITDRVNKDIFEVSLEFENNFYLTRDYPANYYCVEWLYYNSVSNTVSIKENHSHNLINVPYGISSSQALTANGIDKNGKAYTNKYSANVAVNVKIIDNLTCVNVIEFDKDNSIIKTTEITSDGENKVFNPSENCDYLVVEEIYTQENGETYSQRTLINKGNNDRVTLKFPYKYGLVIPTELKIKW